MSVDELRAHAHALEKMGNELLSRASMLRDLADQAVDSESLRKKGKLLLSDAAKLFVCSEDGVLFHAVSRKGVSKGDRVRVDNFGRVTVFGQEFNAKELRDALGYAPPKVAITRYVPSTDPDAIL